MINKRGSRTYFIILLFSLFCLLPSSARAVTFETVQDLWVDGNAGVGTTAPGTYGRIEVKQASDANDKGIAVGNAALTRTMRLWVDTADKSYVESGSGGVGTLILNSGSGLVGIGKTNPAYNLDVTGDIRASGTIYGAGLGSTPLTSSGNLRVTGAGPHYISQGNVGIGTTNPGAVLDVLGGQYNTGIRITSSSVSGAGVSLRNTDTAGREWDIISTGSSNGGGAGNLGFYDATGAYKLYIHNNGGLAVGSYAATNAPPANGLIVPGSVGIGTTNPGNIFAINTAGGSYIILQNANVEKFALNLDSNVPTFYDKYDGAWHSSIMLRNGNVGIGTAAPAARLGVYSDTTSDGLFVDILQSPRITLRDRGNSDTILGVTGTAGQDNLFISTWNVTNAFVVNGTSGNVGIGSATPTAKLDINGDIRLGSGTRGRNIYDSYMALGETLSAASTILGNNIKASSTVATNVVRFANGTDPGNFIKETYNVGITFHTNITSGLGVDIAENTNERMRIDLGGNVGIGTINSVGRLTVGHSSPAASATLYGAAIGTPAESKDITAFTAGVDNWHSVAFRQAILTGTVAGRNPPVASTLYIENAPAAGLNVTISNPYALWVDEGVSRFDGNVGIGTAIPAKKLDVDGSLRAYNSTPTGVSYIYAGAVKSLETVPYDLGGISAYYIDSGWNSARLALLGPALNGYGAPLEYITFKSDGTNMLNYIQGRVGIGSASPAYTLDVAGDIRVTGNIIAPAGGSTQGYWALSGSSLAPTSTNYNVGIGTASPLYKLDVAATSRIIGGDAGYTALMVANTGSGNAVTYYDAINGDFSGGDYGSVGQNNAGYMEYNIGGSSPAPYHVFSGGNVGIGTIAPGYTFEVSGTAHIASTLKVYNGTWTSNGNDIFLNAGTTGQGIYLRPNGDGSSVGSAIFGASGIHRFFDSAGNEQVRFNNGNIGIGTTSPGYKLEVKTPSTGVGDYGLKVHAGYTSSDNVVYFTGNPAAGYDFIMKQTGNVGIGTINPDARLTVYGGESNYGNLHLQGVTGGIFRFRNASGSQWGFLSGYPDGNKLALYDYEATGGVGIRMLFDEGGNVGIGTASPGNKLDINGTAKILNNNLFYSNYLRGYVGDNLHIDAGSGQTMYLNYYQGSAIRMGPSGGHMVIDSGGNVGIGTASPGYRLDVFGAAGDVARFIGSTNESLRAYLGSAYKIWQTNNNDQFGYFGTQFYVTTNGGTEQVRINNSGYVGIGTTNPGYTLQIGQNTAANNTDYSLAILRHGTLAVPGTYSTIPAITVSDLATDGPATLDTTGLVSFYFPRITDGDTYAANATLFTLGNDYGNALRVDGRRNTWISWDRATTSTQVGSLIVQSGNVGIGSVNPAYKLDVIGDIRVSGNIYAPTGGSTQGYWALSGSNLAPTSTSYNVGIGKASPLAVLDVAGELRVSNTAGIGGDYNNYPVRIISYYSGDAMKMIGNSGKEIMGVYNYNNLVLGQGYGNVGIGTASPGAYKLDLWGSAWNNIERIYSTGSSSGIEFWDGNARRGVVYSGTDFGLLDNSTNWAVRIPYGTNNVIFGGNGGNVGIGTGSPGAYRLNVNGAVNGGPYYIAGTSNYITSNSGYLGFHTVSNEMTIGADSSTLYINYRPANGTTVTNYIWNAGSGGSYASHNMGSLGVTGTLTVTGIASAAGLNIYQQATGIDGTSNPSAYSAGTITQHDVYSGIEANWPASYGTLLTIMGRSGHEGLQIFQTPSLTADLRVRSTWYPNQTNGWGAWRTVAFSDSPSFSGSISLPGGIWNSSGNVGIGTVNPSQKLEIGNGDILLDGTSNPMLRFGHGADTTYASVYRESATGNLFMKNDQGGGYIVISGNNVGIGTVSPAAKLESFGNANVDLVRVNYAGNTGGLGIDSAATYWGTSIFQGGSKRFTVESNNGILVGGSYQSSDAPANGAIIEGNVGIGTAGPGHKLDVSGNISALAGNKIGFRYSTSDSNFYQYITVDSPNGVSPMRFHSGSETGGNVQAYQFDTGNKVGAIGIDNDGKIGIGTVSPARLVEVKPASGDAYIQLTRPATNTQSTLGFRTASTDDWLIRTDDATSNLHIYDYGISDYAMTLQRSTGYVGIGTVTPNTRLHSYSYSTDGTAPGRTSIIDVLTLHTDNTNIPYRGFGQGIEFRGRTYQNATVRALGRIATVLTDDSVTNTGTAIVFQNVADSFTATSPVEQMRINYNGYVGIGSAVPAYKLDVVGDIRLTGNLYGAANTTQGHWQLSGSNLAPTSTSYNVGIGTASPATKLHIHGSNDQLRLSTGATWSSIYAMTGASNTGALIFSSSDAWLESRTGNLRFAAGGVMEAAERLTLLSSGYVGVGTAVPTAKLTVFVGSAPHSTATGLAVTAGTGGANLLSLTTNTYHNWLPYTDGKNYYSATDHIFRNQTHATDYMIINSSGNVGIGTAVPKAKLGIHSNTDGDGILIANSTNVAGTYSDITWQYSETDSSYGSAIRFRQTDTGHGGNLSFHTDNTSGTLMERITIDRSGNVGIGTASPTDSRVHILADWSNRGQLKLDTPTAGGLAGLSFNQNNVYKGWMAYGNNAGNNAIEIQNYSGGSGGSILLNPAYGGGNVGIGTSNPAAQMSGTLGLAIYDANYPAVGFKNPTTSWLWYGQTSTFRMWNASAGDIMLADTGGNVGIGTAPATRFHVVRQTFSNTVPVVRFDNGAQTAYQGVWDTAIVVQPDVPSLRLIETNTGVAATQQELSLAVGDSDAVIRSSSTVGNGLSLMVNAGPTDSGYNEALGTLGIKILNSGYVGIGTASPSYKLHVSGDLGVTGTIYGNVASGYTAGGWVDDGTAVRLATSTDNVGIGIAAPSAARLQIVGNDNQIAVDTAVEGAAGIFLRQAGANQWEIYDYGDKFHLYNYGTAADAITVKQVNSLVGIRNANPTSTLHMNAHNNGWEGGLWLTTSDGSLTFKLHPEISAGYGLMIDGAGQGFSFYSGDTRFLGGNVGIGTSPAVKFHVIGSGEMVRFETTNTGVNGYAQIGIIAPGASNYIWSSNNNSPGWYGGSSALNIYTGQNSPIAFFTNGGNQRMTIAGNGNVGIGTADPYGTLHITKDYWQAINLGGTSDPSNDQGNRGITWGYRSDGNPYYMINTRSYNNGLNVENRLQLNWHTGIDIGAHPSYGGTRFYDNSPSMGGGEIMSVGKGDSNVRVVNNLLTGGYVNSGGAVYVGNTSNYITSNSGYLGIHTVSNEMTIGADSSTLYINYRPANGTTVTNYIWNAGSGSTYAYHTIGGLSATGTATFSNGVHGNLYERFNSASTYIANPKGGWYYTSASAVTGALAVWLPTKVSDSMISFWVDVYDYAANTSFSVFVSGYPYAGAGTWSNTSAMILGSVNRDFTVRFGSSNDNSKAVVYIGETGTVWNYPQVVVRDVLSGYSTQAGEIDNLPWSVTFETALQAVGVTRTSNLVYGDFNKLSNKPSTYTDDDSWTGQNPTYTTAGYVGIGTASPTARLHSYTTGSEFAIYGVGVNRGVVGEGGNQGVYGSSSSGTGVYGTGPGYGVFGTASGGAGTGVYGTGVYGVYASGSSYGIYSNSGTNYFAGNVGIGTVSPIGKLHVNGRLSLAQSAYTGMLTFGSEESTWTTGISQYDSGWAEMRIWTKSYGSIYFANSHDGLNVTSLPGDGMVLKYNKLGIGSWGATEVPSEKLHVKGNILATGTISASGAIGGSNISGSLLYGGGDGLSGAGTATTWDPRPGPVYDRYVIGYHTGISLHGYPGYGGVRLYSAGYPTHATSVLRLEASSAVYTYGGLYSDGNLVIHAGNISSYAPIKDGSNYVVVPSWIKMTGNQVGLYWPNWSVSAYSGVPYIYPNYQGSYGSFVMEGYRNGYNGIYWQNASGTTGNMFDTAGNGGDYDTTTGWHYYWSRSNACLGIGGSTTQSGYKAYVNGAMYVTGALAVAGSISSGTSLSTGGTLLASGGITPQYDSGWIYVDIDNASYYGNFYYYHGLGYLPRKIEILFSPDTSTFIAPVWMGQQDHWSNPIGFWVYPSYFRFTVNYDRYVYRAYRYDTVAWENYRAGYYRVILYK